MFIASKKMIFYKKSQTFSSSKWWIKEISKELKVMKRNKLLEVAEGVKKVTDAKPSWNTRAVIGWGGGERWALRGGDMETEGEMLDSWLRESSGVGWGSWADRRGATGGGEIKADLCKPNYRRRENGLGISLRDLWDLCVCLSCFLFVLNLLLILSSDEGSWRFDPIF